MSDLIAAVIVTVMLIPQSLAYAMLAGLPPHYGLYASIAPIVVYSLLGSSTSLAVGPVAIASIMTASTLSNVVSTGLVSYVDGAITLAFLSGAILLLLGFLRFGFIADFLSHSVVSGFITASGLIIAMSQLKHLMGTSVSGHTFFELAYQLGLSLTNVHGLTLLIGVSCVFFLLMARRYGVAFLSRLGFEKSTALAITRMAPIAAVCVSTVVVGSLALEAEGVAIVGDIPIGLASPHTPSINFKVIEALFLPALFIAVIGYIESMSVGRTLGAKTNQKIDSNQELIALGGANIASAAAGAFPVTGGFSRSVVNFDAGARTQLAGIYTAIGIALASLFLTPYLYYLPIAMLAATIIVAVLALIDTSALIHAWRASKSDFIAVLLTITVTLGAGVEAGVASGIMASVILHLYHTSTPHIAEIGLLPETEHFRNIKHYQVRVNPSTVSLRIDESILFFNANFLESYIIEIVSKRLVVSNVILHCGAVNTIDLSGIEMLKRLNTQLLEKDVRLHLSDVKIPVKALLEHAKFLPKLGGQIYRSHFQAYVETQMPSQPTA